MAPRSSAKEKEPEIVEEPKGADVTVFYPPGLLTRLRTRHAESGLGTFAEFCRHMAVDYMNRYPNQPKVTPAE